MIKVDNRIFSKDACSVCGRLGEPHASWCEDLSKWLKDSHQGKRPPARCGTNSGYLRHLRLGETTCGACRAAQNAYHRQRYAEAAHVKAL